MFKHSVTDNTFATVESFMFRDSDINIKKFCKFQKIISLRFSVCFDQKSSIF